MGDEVHHSCLETGHAVAATPLALVVDVVDIVLQFPNWSLKPWRDSTFDALRGAICADCGCVADMRRSDVGLALLT